ncbi:MAG: MOSC domain-containing protein [Candidatus Vogelbacteria bacterium]|nr:MOSC domain-containing protein [Candidatus Vogelbacteria bacterium]
MRAIYVASDKGQPMVSVQAVNAITGRGLEGDRYKDGRGAFSKHRVGETFRDVSLIAVEAIAEANKEVEIPFSPEDTRRNILTERVDLNTLVGQEFSVGDVRMLGVELCTPCNRPSALAKKPGFETAFQGRGGLRARILTDGVIIVGDVISF